MGPTTQSVKASGHKVQSLLFQKQGKLHFCNEIGSSYLLVHTSPAQAPTPVSHWTSLVSHMFKDSNEEFQEQSNKPSVGFLWAYGILHEIPSPGPGSQACSETSSFFWCVRVLSSQKMEFKDMEIYTYTYTYVCTCVCMYTCIFGTINLKSIHSFSIICIFHEFVEELLFKNSELCLNTFFS